MKQEIIFLTPVFKQMLWGGNRLGIDWPYQIPGDDTGECWAVSAHPNGDCTVKTGTFQGKRLSALWKECPELFGNVDGDRFPLLIKIIDAKTDLSIQVHPDDAYAKANENGSLGKTECWYILEAEESSKLVVGHNATTKAELEDMIHNGRWKDFIREVPVKKGDFIQIEPGTVHAIKGGLQILETQQNSDITYRVYDYDRLQNGKPRELHIEKSIDVITVPAKSVEDSILHMPEGKENAMNLLIDCPFFKVWKTRVDGTLSVDTKAYPFLIMSVIAGEGKLGDVELTKGDHFIVPAEIEEISLTGKMDFIVSTI